MFFNLYPLLNTAFINLGKAQFPCDLIIGVSIDICAHIFQIIRKTAARTCLLFCSLLTKIMVLEGVLPLTDGKILAHLQPLSMISLQASKSHSSKAPKSEFFPHATPSSHDSATPVHTEIASPITLELQMISTPTVQPSSQAVKISTLIKSLSQHISGFERILYSTNNQVQMRHTTIELQLDAIQQKLEDSL